MLTLNNLKISQGSKTKKKRRGRGNASGKGNYSGRGMKGQKSRSGGKSGLKRLGMKKIIAQFPKQKGFNRQKAIFQIVNLNILENNFKAGEEVTIKKLFKLGLIDNIKEKVKILGNGEISKKLIVQAHGFSKSAKAAIIKTGGEAILTIRKTRKSENVKIKKVKEKPVKKEKQKTKDLPPNLSSEADAKGEASAQGGLKIKKLPKVSSKTSTKVERTKERKNKKTEEQKDKKEKEIKEQKDKSSFATSSATSFATSSAKALEVKKATEDKETKKN